MIAVFWRTSMPPETTYTLYPATPDSVSVDATHVSVVPFVVGVDPMPLGLDGAVTSAVVCRTTVVVAGGVDKLPAPSTARIRYVWVLPAVSPLIGYGDAASNPRNTSDPPM